MPKFKQLDKASDKEEKATRYGRGSVTTQEYESLELLSTALDNQVDLTLGQKGDLQRFIISSLGNMQLNKRLNQSEERIYDDLEIGGEAVRLAKNLSYNLRNQEMLEKAIEKARILSSKSTDEIIKPEEKLTLAEYGCLRDAASLQETFVQLNNKGILATSQELIKTAQKINEAADFVSQMDERFNAKFKMPPGTVIFNHEEKIQTVSSGFTKMLARLAETISSKFNPKVIDINKGVTTAAEEQPKLSQPHIKQSKGENFSLHDYLYCDTYAINLEKLISPEKMKAIVHIYSKTGDNKEEALQKINEMYQRIERDIHDSNARLPVIKDPIQMIKPSLFKQAANKVRQFFGGKTSWENQIDRKEARMISSQFVARTTFETLRILNKDISNEIRNKYDARAGMDTIKIPFSEKDLSKLNSPQKLLSALRPCLKRVSASAGVEDFIHIRQPGKK